LRDGRGTRGSQEREGQGVGPRGKKRVLQKIGATCTFYTKEKAAGGARTRRDSKLKEYLARQFSGLTIYIRLSQREREKKYKQGKGSEKVEIDWNYLQEERSSGQVGLTGDKKKYEKFITTEDHRPSNLENNNFFGKEGLGLL